jgi:hypothetical protein
MDLLDKEMERAKETPIETGKISENSLSRIIARDVAQSKATTPLKGPCAQILSALEEEKRAKQRVSEAISEAHRLASKSPKELGPNFIREIESLIPSMEDGIDREDFNKCLGYASIITKAAKHGNEVVPDEWIKEVTKKAAPKDGRWRFTSDGDTCFFYLRVLKQLAEDAPNRIHGDAFESVARTAVFSADKPDDRPTGLCESAYRTLKAMVPCCEMSVLSEELEQQIRKDAEDHNDLRLFASGFYDAFCAKRDSERPALTVFGKVKNFLKPQP